jgi:hypothetical protein
MTIAIATVLAAAPAFAQDAAPDAGWTPPGVGYDLALVNGAPYVDLEIDGHPGTFLFDTGANTSGVDVGWMRATGIWYWAGAPATVGGTTGALPLETAIFDQLVLGSGSFDRPVFTIQDFSGFIPPPGRQQSGLLGMDFIAGFETTLDLPNGRVTLATAAERGPPPPDAVAIPLSLPLNLPTVTVRIGGVEVPCRLDTGAAYQDDRPFLDVNEAAVAAIAATGRVLKKTGEIRMVGVSGPETRDLLEGPPWAPLVLRAGATRVRGIVLVVDRRGTVGTEPSPLALAGAPILGRLGRLVLDPFAGQLWIGGF